MPLQRSMQEGEEKMTVRILKQNFYHVDGKRESFAIIVDEKPICEVEDLDVARNIKRGIEIRNG
jgi:hypothetical protein